MKIIKKEGSTYIELETEEEKEFFAEFLLFKIQQKSEKEDFNKVVENDLEG